MLTGSSSGYIYQVPSPTLNIRLLYTLHHDPQLPFMQILKSDFPKDTYRRLASASGNLLQDISAVVSGLRPSFLLDYLVIEPIYLTSVVRTVLALFPRELAKQQGLCILTLDDCCLITNLKPFQEGHTPQHPLFIEFDTNAQGAGMTARWASEEEQTAMQSKLVAVTRAVLAQLPSASSRTHVPIINLDLILQNVGLTMPTLNGWFLGYPVTYAVHDMSNAESASRCLSTTTLKLYSVFTRLHKTTHLEKSLKKQNAPLFAFSLPVNLVESDKWRERKQEWEESLRNRHKKAISAEIPWDPLRIEETTSMRGISL
jgi:Domain of unknown function (DUF4504)